MLITTAPSGTDRRAFAALCSELQDLKRLAPAGSEYSLADDLFVAAWSRILRGEDWTVIADQTACVAILYVLFPGMDDEFFRAAGLSTVEATEVCRAAFERTLGERASPETSARLRATLPQVIDRLTSPSRMAPEQLPDCLERLRTQPRAGATHPEHPRLVLLPPESHADHCLMTGVYAGLAAAEYGADPGEAFVCGLAHHLQNAFLPDCGWAGELALEPYLQRVIEGCRATALHQFSPHLRPRLEAVLCHHETIATPEGKAISTGDTLDRVLDVKWRVRAAAVTDHRVLGDLDLVHPGPLKDFQTQLLNDTALWITN